MTTSSLQVCVYAGASSGNSDVYRKESYKLGRLFAENNIHVLYGGGGDGIMGALADGVIDNRGEITGVIPEFMVEKGWGYGKLGKKSRSSHYHA